jgi:hypothetical protein
VAMLYETSTGQIKRTFTEAQVKSLKEMFQLYDKFLFNKFENTYINADVKKECDNLKLELDEKNKEHNDLMDKLKTKIDNWKSEYLPKD